MGWPLQLKAVGWTVRVAGWFCRVVQGYCHGQSLEHEVLCKGIQEGSRKLTAPAMERVEQRAMRLCKIPQSIADAGSQVHLTVCC